MRIVSEYVTTAGCQDVGHQKRWSSDFVPAMRIFSSPPKLIALAEDLKGSGSAQPGRSILACQLRSCLTGRTPPPPVYFQKSAQATENKQHAKKYEMKECVSR